MQPPLILDSRCGLVSDVHLSQDQPDLTSFFLDSIKAQQDQLSQLIILGDLFDAWVGDDLLLDDTQGAWARSIFAELLKIGCPIALQHGNRDFLYSDFLVEWCSQHHSGALQLLPELVLAEWHDNTSTSRRLLLSHGDQFCTDDLAYQHWRAESRSSSWQTSFLSKPLSQRLDMAKAMRAQSEMAKTEKAMEIMDVNANALKLCFEEFAFDCLIHGHTHRPAVHALGATSTRYVLSDWHCDRIQSGQPRRGEIKTLATIATEIAQFKKT